MTAGNDVVYEGLYTVQNQTQFEYRSGSSGSLIAGQQISLKPGFRAFNGSDLWAFIDTNFNGISDYVESVDADGDGYFDELEQLLGTSTTSNSTGYSIDVNGDDIPDIIKDVAHGGTPSSYIPSYFSGYQNKLTSSYTAWGYYYSSYVSYGGASVGGYFGGFDVYFDVNFGVTYTYFDLLGWQYSTEFFTESGSDYILYAYTPTAGWTALTNIISGDGNWWEIFSPLFDYIWQIPEFIRLVEVGKPIGGAQITDEQGNVLADVTVAPGGTGNATVTIPVGSQKITITVKDVLGKILSGQIPVEITVNGGPVSIGGSIDILNPGNYTINAGWGDGIITTIVVKVGGVQFMGYDPVVFETKVDNGTLSNADLMPLSELKVAKWMNENGVYGSDVTRDPDHFVVRVYDPNEAGTGTKQIKLETTKSNLTAVGDSTYTDDPTVLICTESPANSGYFYSRELILRSDTVDDRTPNSGFPSFTPDDFTNDRSHIVHLGGTVKVRYPDTGTELSRGEVPVNVRETIDVEIVIFRKTPGGTQTIDLPTVQARWKVVQERYAQLGIWVNYTIRNNGYIDPHPSISLGNGVTIFDESAGPGKLTSEVHAIVDNHGSSSSDVVVFYVNEMLEHSGSNPDSVSGFAAMPVRLASSESSYENIILIDGDKGDPVGIGDRLFTVAHELAHLLMDGVAEPNNSTGHHSNSHNILSTPVDDTNSASASKRFDRYQDTRIFDAGNSNAQSLF